MNKSLKLVERKDSSKQHIIIAVSFVLVIIYAQVCNADKHVSQFGITWTFDKDYTVGQFANGDYWVVGPVTVQAINPASVVIDDRTINGSMVNPSPNLGIRQGYDSAMYGRLARLKDFDPGLNLARPNGQDLSEDNPLILQTSSSLISTVSIPEPGSRPQLKTAAVLTVLDSPAPEGSFRPPYVGNEKNIKFNTKQLDYSLLASLKPIPEVPSLPTVERYFERPWIDHTPDFLSSWQHPSDNMPDYGREIATQVGEGALMLHLDYHWQEKKTLLIRFVQLGIDLFGIVNEGGNKNWVNNGGCASGRKYPILFAGLLLNDYDMKNIGRPNCPDHGPSCQDYVHFGEDDQTFYITRNPDRKPPDGNVDYDIYVPPYAIHGYHFFAGKGMRTGTVTLVKGSSVVLGSDTEWTQLVGPKMFGAEDSECINPTGRAYAILNVLDDTHLELAQPYRGNFEDHSGTVYSGKHYIISDFVYYGHGQKGNYIEAEEYVNGDERIPEWGILHSTLPENDNRDWNTAYRQNGTATSWAGFVLAVHIMDAKELWNHDALFDYMDRYMQIQERIVGKIDYRRQWSKFTESMWDSYRSDYGSTWTMFPKLNITSVGGSVIKIPNKAEYELGETVELRAIADFGYEFAGWSGNLCGMENPRSLTMYLSHSIAANFRVKNTDRSLTSK